MCFFGGLNGDPSPRPKPPKPPKPSVSTPKVTKPLCEARLRSSHSSSSSWRMERPTSLVSWTSPKRGRR